MKKTTILSTILLSFASLTTIQLIASYFIKTENTKHMVQSVWDEIIDEEAYNLKLKKIPKLIFNETSNNMACCVSDFEYSNYMITQTSSRYEIIVNPILFNNQLKENCINGYSGKRFARDLTKCVLRHELRHIWQAENNFMKGEPVTNFNLNAYGQKKEELDANLYACERAVTKPEFYVAKLNMECQNQIGPFTITSDKTPLRNARLKVYMVYPPIISLFM